MELWNVSPPTPVFMIVIFFFTIIELNHFGGNSLLSIVRESEKKNLYRTTTVLSYRMVEFSFKTETKEDLKSLPILQQHRTVPVRDVLRPSALYLVRNFKIYGIDVASSCVLLTRVTYKNKQTIFNGPKITHRSIPISINFG